MRDFTKFSFWQKSHQLTLETYRITKTFPKSEIFNLVAQMRRSSSSIPTNIAEGCGRRGLPELRHFLNIAAGSTSELQYQLLLAKDLHYITLPTHEELTLITIEIRKMIYAYMDKL